MDKKPKLLFKVAYSKRITRGILGWPHRKRLKDLSKECQNYRNRITLDIGCSDLFFDKNIIPLQSWFVGCDLGWEESLVRAKKTIRDLNWNNVEIMKSCGEYIPIKGKIFELILCFETLEHVHDEIKVIDEINRLANNDAILVISAPIEFGFILILKEMFREIISNKLYKGSCAKSLRETRYTLKELFLCGFFQKTNNVQRIPHSHKGYDYRRTLKLLELDWDLIKKKNTPIQSLPDSLSYGCILIFRKK